MGTARLLLALAFAGATFLPIDTTPAPAVLAFAFTLALVTGILFGAAPAWFATRTNPIDALRGAGRSTRDRSSIARKALVVVQATVSVVLVAGSTMLGAQPQQPRKPGPRLHDPGPRRRGPEPAAGHLHPEKLAALYRDVEERLNRIPGVRGAGLALYNPLTDNWGEGVLVAGHPPPPPGDQIGSSWDRVSAGYLQHLGVTLVRGRHFTPRTTRRRSRWRS